MTIRLNFTSIAVSLAAQLALAHLSQPARALEFPGTCRGATAVVTAISGLDSRAASMTARNTMADAIAYCSSPAGGASGASAVNACAAKFMRDYKDTVESAQANCQAGTLTTLATGLPKGEYPHGTWRTTYKFPITPTCGGDNNQAIAVFKILCPSYSRKIETDLDQ
jgi:hypothetical protein